MGLVQFYLLQIVVFVFIYVYCNLVGGGGSRKFRGGNFPPLKALKKTLCTSYGGINAHHCHFWLQATAVQNACCDVIDTLWQPC